MLSWVCFGIPLCCFRAAGTSTGSAGVEQPYQDAQVKRRTPSPSKSPTDGKLKKSTNPLSMRDAAVAAKSTTFINTASTFQCDRCRKIFGDSTFISFSRLFSYFYFCVSSLGGPLFLYILYVVVCFERTVPFFCCFPDTSLPLHSPFLTAQEQCCELSYQSQLLHAGYNFDLVHQPSRLVEEFPVS